MIIKLCDLEYWMNAIKSGEIDAQLLTELICGQGDDSSIPYSDYETESESDAESKVKVGRKKKSKRRLFACFNCFNTDTL